jgi:hypothetical protein
MVTWGRVTETWPEKLNKEQRYVDQVD